MTTEFLTALLRYIDVRLEEHRIQRTTHGGNVTLVEADALRANLFALVPYANPFNVYDAFKPYLGPTCDTSATTSPPTPL